MNYIDVLLLGVLILNIWIGFQRGFVRSIIDLLKWGGAFFIALFFYQDISGVIDANFKIEKRWLYPVSFFTLLFSSLLLLSLIGLVFKKLIRSIDHKALPNRIAGTVPGFFTGIVTAFMITKLLSASLWEPAITETNNSFLSASFNNSTSWLMPQLANVFEQQISGAYEIGEGIYESEEFKSEKYYSRKDLEIKMLELVNTERISRGIKPLKQDKQMYEVALLHGADMFDRGYFSHNTPEGIDPFQRMKENGIKYLAAGENLAHSSTLLLAHQGLMASPGHKANILNPAYGRVGISILDGADKGLMLVQEFRD
ncbi:MAG: CvpA family protein [Bacteroidota bacterium]